MPESIERNKSTHKKNYSYNWIINSFVPLKPTARSSVCNGSFLKTNEPLVLKENSHPYNIHNQQFTHSAFNKQILQLHSSIKTDNNRLIIDKNKCILFRTPTYFWFTHPHKVGFEIPWTIHLLYYFFNWMPSFFRLFLVLLPVSNQ